jgi:hypothetical protein
MALEQTRKARRSELVAIVADAAVVSKAICRPPGGDGGGGGP